MSCACRATFTSSISELIMVVKTCVQIQGNLLEGNGKIKCQFLKNNFDISEGTWEVVIDTLIAKFHSNINTVVRCDFNCITYFEEIGFQRAFRPGTLCVFHLEGDHDEIKTIIPPGEKNFTTFQSSTTELTFFSRTLCKIQN